MLVSLTEHNKTTQMHRQRKREREREIKILIATELVLAWLALLQVLSLAKCLLAMQISAACSRRGGGRTVLCLGVVPSPQFLLRSPLSGLESSHLLSPLHYKKKEEKKNKRKKKPLCFLFFLIVLFQHYFSCYFSVYIYIFFP